MNYQNGDDNNNNNNNDQNGYNFLIQPYNTYFFYNNTIEKSFNPNDTKHQMIKVFYEAFDYEIFQKNIQWGMDNKHDNIDAYVDFKEMQKINENYLEMGKKDNNNINMNMNILDSQIVQDQLNPDHPLEIISTKIMIDQVFYLNAYDIINCFNIALHCIRQNKLKKKYEKKINVQFYNFEQQINFAEIKANMINQFISVRGVVLKTAPIKLMYLDMRFQCLDCNQEQIVKFQGGQYSAPNQCRTVNCKGRQFTPLKNHHYNKVIQYQRIRIQEIEEGDQVSGRVPHYLDCELTGSLVGQVINGDNIIANGILRAEAIEQAQMNKRTQAIHQNFLEVNSITNNKSENKAWGKDFEDDDLSDQDYQLISKLGETEDIFYILVKSMCPTIYGHELMKAGILLSIIGGSSIQEKRGNNVFSSDDSRDFYRQDSHVLLIGDPGLGKSQMLKFVAFITPRSVYVTGNATSNAGLTVSVSRDSSSGESTLEAGALILSDQGVCCIDEFDKMQEQHQSLLEAMEQQTVSLAKSGVLCSLQCRTSIIACANPIGGHYNKQKSIKENIKISNAILSRFDLVFLMLDKADNERDTKLSKHIMKLHNNLQNLGKVNQNQHLKNKNTYNQDEEADKNQQQEKDLPGYLRKQNLETPSKNRIVQDMINQLDKRKNEQQKQNGKFDLNYLDRQYVSFSDKLSKKCQNVDQILDPLIIRKYMSYAKKHVRPTLSSEAADVLKKFYITLRENNSSSSSMPITARQLESLIRLAQARAKIELRNEVTEKDAEDVVDLMYESLFDSLEDLNYEGGNKKNINIGQGLKNVDLGNIGTLSKPKQTKIFIQKLQQVANEKNSYEFPLQEMTKIARNMQMNVGDFRMYIEELNSKGTLLHKGQKVYELKEKPFL